MVHLAISIAMPCRSPDADDMTASANLLYLSDDDEDAGGQDTTTKLGVHPR